jgi:hypothetical protein
MSGTVWKAVYKVYHCWATQELATLGITGCNVHGNTVVVDGRRVLVTSAAHLRRIVDAAKKRRSAHSVRLQRENEERRQQEEQRIAAARKQLEREAKILSQKAANNTVKQMDFALSRARGQLGSPVITENAPISASTKQEKLEQMFQEGWSIYAEILALSPELPLGAKRAISELNDSYSLKNIRGLNKSVELLKKTLNSSQEIANKEAKYTQLRQKVNQLAVELGTKTVAYGFSAAEADIQIDYLDKKVAADEQLLTLRQQEMLVLQMKMSLVGEGWQQISESQDADTKVVTSIYADKANEGVVYSIKVSPDGTVEQLTLGVKITQAGGQYVTPEDIVRAACSKRKLEAAAEIAAIDEMLGISAIKMDREIDADSEKAASLPPFEMDGDRHSDILKAYLAAIDCQLYQQGDKLILTNKATKSAKFGQTKKEVKEAQAKEKAVPLPPSNDSRK